MSVAEGLVIFVDRTDDAGIAFLHMNAATDEKYMVETMGSGGGFLDYDGVHVQESYSRILRRCRSG